MFRFCFTALTFVACHLLAFAGHASAQGEISGCRTDLIRSLTSLRTDANHSRLEGTRENPVQVDCDDMQLFATTIDLYQADGKIVAVGDIAFVSGESRIAADRLEYDTKTKTGTFYNASGTTLIRDRDNVEPRLEGSQEPNAFFWGEELHKIGPRKYKVVRGGFTACVQPTPRWDVAAGSITIELDDHALLTNSLFRVKGVPLMYLPIFYYPIEEDDRSTGFLMPIYGNSTQKGQSLTNQFFWAIGRSHDATFSHDWFSKAGQGYRGEYRYVLSPGSRGNADVYMLNESEVTADEASATNPVRPAARSYNINGSLTQQFPRGWRAQGGANYFSSLLTQQRYQQDVYQATQRRRNLGGTLTGNWSEYLVSVRADQNDYFDAQEALTRTGSLPRVTVNRAERTIGRSQIYFGATGEYVTLLRSRSVGDVEISNDGLTRMDIMPTVRIPFTKYQFFTVNSAVTWRGTYWTESLDDAGRRVEDSVGRQYFDFSARAVGPVFNRIFDPGQGTRWKHVVEPSFMIQRTTAIQNFNNIPKLEGTDYITGNVTMLRYGVANRLYAKKDVSREVASVTVSQTYYSDPGAAQYDPNYQTSYAESTTTNFSPVSLLARVSPNDRIQGQFKTEWDPTVHTLRTLSASGNLAHSHWIDAWAGWSMRRFIPELPGFNNPNSATHTLNGAATLRTYSRRFGGTYSFDYDFRRDYFLQQRIVAYYNAQCCGVAAEYQTWSLTGLPGVAVPKDRRFNISFTLAGIGTFSNFFGALSGQSSR